MRPPSTWVRELGGQLIPAGRDDPSVIPVDVSFGDGEPLLAAAPPGSASRALLERHLAPFLLDARQVLQLSGRNERLAESASTDLLTGLPNRRMLDCALGRLSAGDEVLRVFGRVLRDTVRGGDTVGRFGGESRVVKIVERAIAEHGRLDILVNNAGGGW